MRIRVVLAVASLALLAGCASTAPPVPSPTSAPPASSSASAEPETRPILPLGGDCTALMSDAELSAATATEYTAAAADRKSTWIAASIAATSCRWQEPAGPTSVWVTVVPNATMPAADATSCTASAGCFFTRVIRGYRIDGYVALPTATLDMVDRIMALVSSRLTEPPASPWRPEGVWSGELGFSDLTPLDVSALLSEASGPMGTPPGGYQPDSISAALGDGRYSLYFWEDPSGEWVALEILLAGGWLFGDVAERIAVQVPGATAAAWVPDEYPADAMALPGGSPLLVTDGVNLLQITAVGDPEAIVSFAAAALALLHAR